ncbi:hypothetical protein JCM15548_224 [Geofilum rubicundum JCM 15548]|uniref:Uncharacterized protein n=1 Tax=Geofilum rubicundum JCM 15548 TaxID=1236989 RepID=A0A0E9LTH1_9BACT|nr:hypothetical protein JCM15548_224 [Geofilum rubicundum JCM 15548]
MYLTTAHGTGTTSTTSGWEENFITTEGRQQCLPRSTVNFFSPSLISRVTVPEGVSFFLA